MKKVFLGGTCNNSTWRDTLIPHLKIPFYNPVVAHEWTLEDQLKEESEKQLCDIHLYVLTPKSENIYSIAEVVDDSNKYSAKTIMGLLQKDDDNQFTKKQWLHLKAVAKIVRENGATVIIDDLNSLIQKINEHQ